jgi:hypothetical protein
MIEIFDDSEGREALHPLTMVERYGKYVEPAPVPVCPYCAPAIKGGPLAGDRWHDANGVKHWVRVDSITEEGRGLSVWKLDAACGAMFNEIVDSGD